MTFDELKDKYKIHVINGHHYYEYALDTETPVLTDTTPFYFECDNIKLYPTGWTNLVFDVLKILDSLNPKTKEELLSYELWWSKQKLFSETKNSNHRMYRDLYINLNHTATHSFMMLVNILEFYDVDLKSCLLLISRHHVCEPKEVKEYYHNEAVKGFKKALKSIGLDVFKANHIINNFETINGLLHEISPGFTDFFLFEDEFAFFNYKTKTIEYAQTKYITSPKSAGAIEKCLNYLDSYFADKEFFDNNDLKLSEDFIPILSKEIQYLFDSLKTTTISIDKLYSRMMLLHYDKMKELGTSSNRNVLFSIAKLGLRRTYYFSKPFISLSKETALSKEQMIKEYAYSKDSFTLSELKQHAKKLNITFLTNIQQFAEDIADDYVSINEDKFVRKSSFIITDSDLEKIKDEIDFYINSFSNIDSETYKGFSSLPTLVYPWNKYLLLGIINSFLREHYAVENSGSTYSALNFKVTLVK